VGMAAATALGTLMPMLSLGAASGRIAPPTYYATVLIPMSAILLCLTLIAVVKTARAHQRIAHLADFIFVLTASVATGLAVFGRLTLVGVLMGICWLVYAVHFRFGKMGDESF